MTQLETTRPTTAVREAFTRPWAAWSGSILVLTAISQVIASRGDDDQETRDSWLTDTVFVVVATLLFAGIAYFFARRALKGDEQRQDRTVIGLGVFGAVMGVVGWFTAAPHAIALAAIFLARATGAKERSGGARAAVVVSTIVVIGLIVFCWSTLVVEDLL